MQLQTIDLSGFLEPQKGRMLPWQRGIFCSTKLFYELVGGNMLC